ncbi:uncharacterized protein EV154DRAFT_488383 [Mucor mucedo]|uniref:uncharacterized protein n=1 Tax=Mucor mucedo TaxID=29922 RepID=UPI00221FD2E9|nr:uncharacterized protein EV154DRAFT_488383 [Mucor mucedo]KAI7867223.1 hypothetical protein EV154DRAFT_488383 [Mucor mucedo]
MTDFQFQDIKTDGFCGFRAVATIIYGSEDNYCRIKKEMMATLEDEKYRGLYKQMGIMVEKKGDDQFYDLEKRVRFGREGEENTAPIEYFFTSPGCLQVCADTYDESFVLVDSENVCNSYSLVPLFSKKRLIKPLVIKFMLLDDRVACFCEKCTTRGLKYTFVSRKTRYNHERDSRIDFKQKRQEYKKEMGDRKLVYNIPTRQTISIDTDMNNSASNDDEIMIEDGKTNVIF